MRILITGAGGFVGNHLAQHLHMAHPDVELFGTVFSASEKAHPHVQLHTLNLCERADVTALIQQVKPDRIFHLAAQAFVPRSFEEPWETLQNNIQAQLNVIKACTDLNLRPRILITSSAEIYGPVTPDELPLNEQAELRPTSPYSVSKITQDMLALQYHLSHDLPTFRARPFNHFGPGQREDFVAPAFAMQIARIEASAQEPIIHVGDLSARRDFTDVRDIVRAYDLITEKGQPGAVYNIASGEARSIQSLLDNLLTQSTAAIRVQIDPDRLRPTSIPVLQGDYATLRTHTGWKPEITFQQSLNDILEDCRQRVRVQLGEQ